MCAEYCESRKPNYERRIYVYGEELAVAYSAGKPSAIVPALIHPCELELCELWEF